MYYDLWLARHEGSLWFAWAGPGTEPMMFPQPAKTVREAYSWLRKAGIRIGQVGIADAGMLGLSD